MDKTTFGTYNASYDLVDILNEINDKKVSKKTTNILQLFFATVNDIMHTKVYTDRILRHYKKGFIKYMESVDLPDKVKTRILNISKAKINESIKLVKNR